MPDDVWEQIDLQTLVLADNGQSALDIHRIKPQDVVLLDMFMPIKDGLETLTALRQARPAPKIIAVSPVNEILVVKNPHV